MAAFRVTAADINQALRENNYQSAAGQVKGALIATSVKANTDLHNAKAFGEIVVRSDKDTLVRLKDVAK